MSYHKKQLVRYSKKLGHSRLVYASAGNISVKSKTVIYISGSGISLEEVSLKNIVTCNLHGQKIAPKRFNPSLEFGMHIQCYMARKDVCSVIHFHPTYASILANSTTNLKALLPDFAWLFGYSVPVIPYRMPGTCSLSNLVGKIIKKQNGVILKNHGALVVGRSLKEAFYRAEVLDETAKVYVISKLLGKIDILSKQDVKNIQEMGKSI